MMRLSHLICALLCIPISTWGQSSPQFSAGEVAADLQYLHESLQATHYDLYAYTNERDFEATYRQTREGLPQDSLTLLETINTFQRLISTVNNGHTEIDFPAQSYGVYAYAGGTVFPLEIAFEHGQPLVRKNWSERADIPLGAELLSINGQTMAEILATIYPQVSAERPYFKQAKIEMLSFPRCYWQVYGQQANYTVVIQSEGKTQTYTIEAINLIEGYETKRDEVLNARMQLAFFDRVAYLNPGNFGGDEAQYQHFVDSAFLEIKAKQSENLIIDLRNNAGGDNSFSDYLVSFFADQPFRWNAALRVKTSELLKENVRLYRDTTSAYWQKALSHKNGEIYEYDFGDCQPKAEAKRFRGKVYVLVNRQSHSQSAVTAAQIQDYQFGTIVGEETGDYPSLYASQFQYTLPRTQIPVKVSKGYIVRVNGSTAARGVIPDIYIKDHLLDEEDEILDTLLEMIR
ncbi:MAG: S41 family peptidase [Bacteroidota bacterium]